MHGRFLGCDEARAHIHAFGTHGQSRDKAAAIRHAARGDKRDLQFIGSAGEQDHVRNIVFPRMPTALEAVHRDGVTADLLGLDRMAHGCAFVDDLDTVLFQHRHPLLRVIAGCLDDLHTALDDGLDVTGIVRRREGRKECQVHAKGLVRHLAAAGNLLGQKFRGALGKPRDDAKSASIRYSGRHLCKADIVHATLDNGVLYAEEFRDAGFHVSRSVWMFLECRWRKLATPSAA